MPVTYQIDPSRKLIHTRCIGDVTPEEIAQHFRELEQDPARPDRLNVLLDLREETSLPEIQDLREVNYQLNKSLRTVRFGACAVVVCDEALFGMMRMFGVFTAEHFDVVEVFRAITDAEAWLATVAI
jgi:SpoIIAA-like